MGRAFEYRKASKFARWDKMAKAFTKIGREIAMAVKQGGPIADTNAPLRRAIQNAKGAQMPKDRVEAAIKRAISKDEKDFSEVLYEGMAPHGVAVVIETATDNPVRTVANLRAIFSKKGGTFGTQGMHDFIFTRKGVFKIEGGGIDMEEFEFELIDFGSMQKALEDKGIEIISSELQRFPTVTKELGEEQMDEVLDFIDRLEQDDDVQSVYHNLH